MKIKCSCNTLIIDQTDHLKNKGHIISDTQWFEFWDAIDAAIENPTKSAKEKEAACMQLRKQNPFKTAWECNNCGALYINGNDNALKVYRPDSKSCNGVLNKI